MGDSIDKPARLADRMTQASEVNTRSSNDKTTILNKSKIHKLDFYDHGDGTVSDLNTGLTWMRCALGQTWDGTACIGTAKKHSLTSNLSLNSELFPPNQGWNLPTITQFKAVIKNIKKASSDGIEFFSNLPRGRFFWTKSRHTNGLSCVYAIKYPDGNTESRRYSDTAFALLVRESRFSIDVIAIGSGIGTVIRDIDAKPLIIS